jgi:flagellar motor switch/type III secretory pathway protein FliN
MDEVESLSSILGETPFSTGEPVAPAPDPAPPAVEQNVETPVAETTSQTRDESGRFAKVEEPKVEAKPELTKADVAAIIDERRKRQELQRELEQLRQQQPQKPKTDLFENPDAAIAERLQERLSPLENTIFKLQVELAKSKMPDFDDAAKAFFTHAQNDQVLMHQADTAPDQFAFIYREGKRLQELGDVGGDIVKYKEKVTAEARAEIVKRDEQIKNLSAQIEALSKAQAELAAVPRSLNQLGTSVPKTTDADPEDINQLVRFKAG